MPLQLELGEPFQFVRSADWASAMTHQAADRQTKLSYSEVFLKRTSDGASPYACVVNGI